MSKRAGTLVTLDELVDAIGVDALAVRAGPLLDRLADRHRRRAVGRRGPTTTRSSTCSTRTPGSPRSAATRPSSGISVPPLAEFDSGLLAHERESDLLKALGEFPRVVAAAAELREPHRVARYLEELAGTYHRFYDACRVLPQGDEDGRPTSRTRGCGCARRPGSCSPTGSACSASPHRNGCSERECERAHEAGAPARRTCARARRAGAGCAAAGRRRTPLAAVGCWPATAPRATTARCSVGGVDVRDLAAEFGTPAYVLDEADFRARCRDFAQAFAGADVYYAGKAFLLPRRSCADRRGGPRPRRLLRRRAGRRRCAAGRAAGADRLPRQQQVASPS